MAYVKLDCGMLYSTLWADREGRETFITALLMAIPHTLDKPAPQLEVRSLNTTGWSVPPGEYGFVPAAGLGIARQAGVEQDVGFAALERLGNPEPGSRSSDYEGRRLVRIDGGYIVLNYFAYRNKDHTSAERARRYRENKKKIVTSGGVTVTRDITQAEADAEANADLRKEAEAAAAFLIPDCPKDMDIVSERRGFTTWCTENGLAPTHTRWRRWVLKAKESGRYAKQKPRPPTEAEVQAERKRIIAAQDA